MTTVYRIPKEPTVQPWFDVMNGYADSSYAEALKLANYIASTDEGGTVDKGTPLDLPEVKDSDIELGYVPAPEVPEYTSSNPTHPGNVAVQLPTHLLAKKPTFNAVKLAINIPALPSVSDPDVPEKPDYYLDKKFPDPLEYTIPDDPEMLGIVIPPSPTINLPEFNGVLPESDNIVPGLTFDFNEAIYESSLLTKIKDALLIRMDGGTGLSPAVENAIWNRGRGREHTASLQSNRAILEEGGQTGFTRPPGAQRAAIDRAVQATQGKIIELQREIMIAQANLEQENIKTSIQSTLALEDILIRNNNQINERSFMVAKYMQDIALEIYKASVTQYQLKIQIYQAEAEVFNSLIKGELTKLEVYKSEIDAQALISGINERSVQIYNARIDAIKTIVETYKTEVEAVSEELRAEGLKIEAYKSDVQAYSEIVAANTQKYVGYGEAIKGEMVKAQINESEVSDYTSRIQAYATEQSAYDTSAKIELDIEGLKIDKFKANLDGFSRQVEADQKNFGSLVDIYRGESSQFEAKTRYKTARADIFLKGFQAKVDQTQFSYNHSLENVKIKLSEAIAESKLKQDGKIAAGSIHSQLAATSLSAINVSASNSSTISNSLGERV